MHIGGLSNEHMQLLLSHPSIHQSMVVPFMTHDRFVHRSGNDCNAVSDPRDVTVPSISKVSELRIPSFPVHVICFGVSP